MQGIFHAAFQSNARKPLRAAVRSSFTPALARASAPNLLRASIVSSRWSVGGVTERNVATRGAELHNFPGDGLLPVPLRVVDQLPEMQHMFKSNYG